MSFFKAFGIGSNQNQNAKKGKDANKRDYDKGNTRDNSKTHLKSGGGRAGGRGNNGGRRGKTTGRGKYPKEDCFLSVFSYTLRGHGPLFFMQYTIIVPTPIDTYNSEFLPHMIEHMKLSGLTRVRDFFTLGDISGRTYTFYSTYTTHRDPEWLISLLREELLWENYIIEKERMKEELETRSFYQKAIERAGRILYNKKYSYGRSKTITKNSLSNYHKEYYTNGEFIILGESDNQSRDTIDEHIIRSNLSIQNCKIGEEGEVIISIQISTESIYIMHLIEKLWDTGIEYYSRKYYYDDTIMGEFPEHLWIMVPIDSIRYILSIGHDFIENFIRYYESSFIGDSREADIPSLLVSGYALSTEAKSKLIKKIEVYHEIFKQSLMLHNKSEFRKILGNQEQPKSAT